MSTYHGGFLHQHKSSQNLYPRCISKEECLKSAISGNNSESITGKIQNFSHEQPEKMQIGAEYSSKVDVCNHAIYIFK